jgi:hypothetical protein
MVCILRHFEQQIFVNNFDHKKEPSPKKSHQSKALIELF